MKYYQFKARTKNFFTVVLKDPRRKSLLTIAFEYLKFQVVNRTIAEQYFEKFFYRKGAHDFNDYLLTESMLHKCWNLNNANYISVLDNKYLFEQFFTHYHLKVVKSHAYNINSVFLANGAVIQVNSKEEFTDFLMNLQKDSPGSCGIFIKKKEGSCGGKGIFKLSPAEINVNNPQLEVVFHNVIRSSYIFQEEVIQHEGISALNPYCLNTIRIDTFTNKQNISKILSSFIRLGVNRSYVDNVSSGGVFVGINLKDGTLCAEAYSDFSHGKGKTFKVHPETALKFEGYRIPYFQEAKELAIAAAQRLPQVKIIGWDIAIQPDGPVLIEGNDTPGLNHSEVGHMGYLHNPVFSEVYAEIKEK